MSSPTESALPLYPPLEPYASGLLDVGSLPHASAADLDLSSNTTWHLVDDLERLRQDRGIERWQVVGGSAVSARPAQPSRSRRHGPAAVARATWETATINLETDEDLITAFAEPSLTLAFARIENPYFRHGGWFDEGQLVRGPPTGSRRSPG